MKKTETPEFKKIEKKVLDILKKHALADARKGLSSYRLTSKSIPDLCEALLPDGTVDERVAIRASVQPALARAVTAKLVIREKRQRYHYSAHLTEYRYIGPEVTKLSRALEKEYRKKVSDLKAAAKRLGLGTLEVKRGYKNEFAIESVKVNWKRLLQAGGAG